MPFLWCKSMHETFISLMVVGHRSSGDQPRVWCLCLYSRLPSIGLAGISPIFAPRIATLNFRRRWTTWSTRTIICKIQLEFTLRFIWSSTCDFLNIKGPFLEHKQNLRTSPCFSIAWIFSVSHSLNGTNDFVLSRTKQATLTCEWIAFWYTCSHTCRMNHEKGWKF